MTRTCRCPRCGKTIESARGLVDFRKAAQRHFSLAHRDVPATVVAALRPHTVLDQPARL